MPNHTAVIGDRISHHQCVGLRAAVPSSVFCCTALSRWASRADGDVSSLPFFAVFAVTGRSCQIADFGLSTLIKPGEKLTKVCGTWAYAAPEMADVRRSGGYDCKFDCWSFGVILFVVLAGYHPFDPDGNLPAPEVRWIPGNCGRVWQLSVAGAGAGACVFVSLRRGCLPTRHAVALPTSWQIKARARAALFDFNQPEWRQVSTSAKDLLRKLIVKNPEVPGCAQHASGVTVALTPQPPPVSGDVLNHLGLSTAPTGRPWHSSARVVHGAAACQRAPGRRHRRQDLRVPVQVPKEATGHHVRLPVRHHPAEHECRDQDTQVCTADCRRGQFCRAHSQDGVALSPAFVNPLAHPCVNPLCDHVVWRSVNSATSVTDSRPVTAEGADVGTPASAHSAPSHATPLSSVSAATTTPTSVTPAAAKVASRGLVFAALRRAALPILYPPPRHLPVFFKPGSSLLVVVPSGCHAVVLLCACVPLSLWCPQGKSFHHRGFGSVPRLATIVSASRNEESSAPTEESAITRRRGSVTTSDTDHYTIARSTSGRLSPSIARTLSKTPSERSPVAATSLSRPSSFVIAAAIPEAVTHDGAVVLDSLDSDGDVNWTEVVN